MEKQVKRKQQNEDTTIGSHLKTITVMLLLMMLMLFAIHCTWVTSNAYSSPSIVLASTNYDGLGNLYFSLFVVKTLSFLCYILLYN